MASQQQVNSDWIKFQQSQGAYDAGGTTDYQKGILANAANLTTPQSTEAASTSLTSSAPAGYFSEAAKKNRYDTGVNTATALQESGGNSFQDYVAGSSDSDFLDRVYLNETGRESDQAGKDYWQEQRDAGMSREDVIKAFGNTQEGMGFDNPNQPGLLGAAATGYQPTGYTAADKANVQGYAAPVQAVTQTYDATNQVITPDQMVADRMAGLLDSDSPYIRQARQQGLLASHARGNLNSSLSAGAAQAAATQAALPIAQQDAGTYASAAANLANASNRANEFGARETNVAALQTNQQEDASSRFGAAAENLANREFTQSTNRAEEFGATAINRAGEFYAGAQNAASIQNANNELSLSLQEMRTEISNYSTDMQRATALDNLGLNLFNTAMNSGVFNNADTIAGYFNTVAGIFPDLGIQLIDQAANTAAEEVVA